MGEILENRCGVCLTHTLHDTYSFLKSLQHRGRDATGMAAIGKDRIDTVKWNGKVDRVSLDKITNIFNEINPDGYHSFVGHVRYATSGSKENVLEDAHPFVKGGTRIDQLSHVFYLDCDAIAVHNGQVPLEDIIKDTDKGKYRTDTGALLEYVYKHGPEETLENISGSYVLIYSEKGTDRVEVLRDRHGMMPSVIGKKDGKHVLASEDIALRKNGADMIKNLEAGTHYRFLSDGDCEKASETEQYPQHCFFQWNYIGDSQSTIENLPIWGVRRKLGEALADHVQPELDLVSYIPECPEIAAMSYAEKRGLPYKEIFYKIREERAFQGPDKDERRNSIESNLHVAPIINKQESNRFLEGKIIGLIDDSIVRGNNAKYARDLLLDHGAQKVHLISYTPPIGIIGDDGARRGCMFGVDMPLEDEFVARDRSTEEISKAMGMPTHYLPYEAMMRVFEEQGMLRENLCRYCIGKEHPLQSDN